MLAGAIQTVEELAPGRVKFVIGTGYTSASTIGRKPATLAEMRECIAHGARRCSPARACASASTPGASATRRGRRIPVLMAASGPKAIEVAGEVADGVLLLVGINRGIVERALELLERGAKRAGRRLEDLEIIWAVRTGDAADHRGGPAPGAAHRRCTGASCAGAATGSSRPGLKLPPLEIPDAVWKIYPDLSHAHDWEAAIAATSFVPDEVVAQLCEAMGLIGTPEDCAARIVEMTKLGVRNLYLMPLETFAPPEPRDRRVPRHRLPPPRRRRRSGVRSYIPTFRSGSGLELRHFGERRRDE